MWRRVALVSAFLVAIGWQATAAWGTARSWPLVDVDPLTRADGACPATAPATEPPPYEQEGRPGWWHSSPDGGIWVMIPPGRTAGGPVKTPWYKPAGSTLEVSGRRLDGAAPPLQFTPGDDVYVGGSFTPSGLGFPVAGCWEVVARAGGSELRAVVEILPRFYRSPVANCQDLYGVVASSDAVALVTVEGTTPDRPGWAWQAVRPELVWKGDVPIGGLGGGSIDVLQETAIEPVLRPEGRYVIFLQSRPGHPWRIVCDGLTVAEVEGERVIHRPGAIGGHPVWIGETLADLDRQLATFTGAGWAPFPAATPGS